MKRIFTLLLALGSMTAVFAQSSHRGRNDDEGRYQRRWKDHTQRVYHPNDQYAENNNYQYRQGTYAHPNNGYYADRERNYDRNRNFGAANRYDGRTIDEPENRESSYNRRSYNMRSQRPYREKEYTTKERNW
ncbi:MAG: hypothetical protein ACXVBR_13505 [Flavisolibacter sp.]